MGAKKQLLQKVTFLILLLVALSASECEFDFSPRDPCIDSPDAAYCYQDLAIQRGDASYCEKIEVSKETGITNLDKDICYMGVAQATGDPKYCLQMKGGEESYERKDCIIAVAKEDKNFDACNLLRGTQRQDCYAETGRMVQVLDLEDANRKIQELEDRLRSDWRNRDLQRELDELKKQQDLMYEHAIPSVQREYFRQQREKLFEDVEDEQLRSMIARDFSQYRGQNSEATVTELFEKMQQIKEEKETIKRLDQEANRLIDDLKSNIIVYGSGQARNAVDSATSYAWEWSFSRGSEEMKWQMSRLEEMKSRYDRASAQYRAINEQIDKFKKVYDEVSEVYNKVNQFNMMVADGKIEEGHAEVLKGAVYLGKGLEYATGYVPVFGSTISTVSKETFDATVKFATKRAQRTTALNKCIEDPLNCDPDGITGY